MLESDGPVRTMITRRQRTPGALIRQETDARFGNLVIYGLYQFQFPVI